MHRTPYPIVGLSVELAEVFGAQLLQVAADAAERRLQVVRGDVSELLQLDIAAYQSVVGALRGFRLRGELRRALGHALLEQFVGLAQRLLQLLAFGNVDDGAQHEQAFVGFDRIEADFDRKFAAVFTQAEQIAIAAHAPRHGCDEELAAQAGMGGAAAHGYQYFHQLPYQLATLIAVQLLSCGVGDNDGARRVDHDHGGRGRFDRRAKTILETLAFGGIDDGAQHEQAFVGIDRIEADFYRDAAAGLALGEQGAAGAHAPRRWLQEEAGAGRRVTCAEFDWHQQVDRLSQQFVAVIAEQVFGFLASKYDTAGSVDHHYRHRR